MNGFVQSPVALRARRMARCFVACQFLMVLLVSGFCLFLGVKAALSAFLGGMAVVAPSAGFSVVLFKATSSRAAHQIVQTFYWGETMKILLSGVLAVLVVRFFEPVLLPFWLGFIAALVGFWLAPIFVGMNVSKGGKE